MLRARHEANKVWLTADHHFFHKNIIRYCRRPFADTASMNQFMADRWNECVAPEDLVYHLGDFGFLRCWEYYADELFKSLRGDKILIRGNHDRGFTLKLPWREIHTGYIDLGEAILVHNGDRFLREHPETHPSNKPVFCANVHEIWKVKGQLLNVGVDVWHFRPVSWEDAMLYWEYRNGRRE